MEVLPFGSLMAAAPDGGLPQFRTALIPSAE